MDNVILELNEPAIAEDSLETSDAVNSPVVTAPDAAMASIVFDALDQAEAFLGTVFAPYGGE